MTAMSGQSIKNFKMDTYLLIAIGILLFSLLNFLFLFKLIRNQIRKQIDDQIKDMITIKGIRDRIGIRIKFKD